MIYKVNIEETINGEFEILANTDKEAFDLARKRYFDCQFVNEPGKLTSVKISIMSKDGYDKWETF